MKKYWVSILLAVSILICVIVYFGAMVSRLRTSVERKEEKQLALIQELDAGITFQTKRQRYILKVRDIIMQVAKQAKVKMTMGTAFKIAESNVYYADKYGIDPNFILAIQRRESNFDIKAISVAGAIGLMQHWEPTTRTLCRILGWEWDPRYLTDIDKSNELAALYIQILKSSYEQQLELVLACYNGGPRNAYYYKVKSKKLAQETAEYVPAVMNFYKEYTKTIGMYLIDISEQSSVPSS